MAGSAARWGAACLARRGAGSLGACAGRPATVPGPPRARPLGGPAPGWRGAATAAAAHGGRAAARPPPSYALYLVTDDEYLDDKFLPKVAAALEGGATAVQLRLKHVSTAEYVRWAEQVGRLARDAGVPLIIDDRLDVALAAEADGLHVGGDDLPWRAARRLLGPDRILGCSTYGRADLVREALHPEVRADYLGSGAVFATSTKHSSVPKGIEHLGPLRRAVAEEAAGRPVPLVAIGGIGLEAAGRCVLAGADGVAAVSALLRHADAEGTRRAAEAMRASVEEALGSPNRAA